MLFITPPKIHDFQSPSPSPSPLLDIMQSLNDILSTEEEKKKVLDPELIKLLDGTPVQPQTTEVKKFEAKKCSRNISNLFTENKSQKVPVNRKFSNVSVGELENDPHKKPFYPQNYNLSSENEPKLQKFGGQAQQIPQSLGKAK